VLSYFHEVPCAYQCPYIVGASCGVYLPVYSNSNSRGALELTRVHVGASCFQEVSCAYQYPCTYQCPFRYSLTLRKYLLLTSDHVGDPLLQRRALYLAVSMKGLSYF
jgi:hypothetical protein